MVFWPICQSVMHDPCVMFWLYGSKFYFQPNGLKVTSTSSAGRNITWRSQISLCEAEYHFAKQNITRIWVIFLAQGLKVICTFRAWYFAPVGQSYIFSPRAESYLNFFRRKKYHSAKQNITWRSQISLCEAKYNSTDELSFQPKGWKFN